MPGFERIPDEHLMPPAPREPSAVHQTPLYVVAFTGEHMKHPDIITLPGARLLRGRRNSVQSIERNAKEIAASHQLFTSADRSLALPKDEAEGSLGYSVSRAHRSTMPPMADFRHTNITADHDLPVELHDYDQLIDFLESQPDRTLEARYLRAFGAYALK